MSACPRCARADLLSVTLTPDGRAMQLRMCRTCEHRWWTHTTPGDIVLDDVIAAVTAS